MVIRLHARGLLTACGLTLLVGLFAVTHGESRRGLYRLEIPLAPAVSTQMQVFWDQGAGHNEAASSWREVSATSDLQIVAFGLGAGPIHGIRLDPFLGPGRTLIGDAVVRDASGAIRLRLPVAELIARYQTSASAARADGSREVTTPPDADDPSVEWVLPVPTTLPIDAREFWILAGRPTVITLIAALLLFAVTLGSRAPAGHVATLAAAWPRTTFGLTTVALWLGSVTAIPLSTTTYLDASWQQTLVWSRLLDLQYGRDLIFTAGPWGWLFSLFYIDGLLEVKWAFEAFGKLGLAALLVWSTRDLPQPRRAWMLFALALLGGLQVDTWLVLLIALLGLSVLLPAHAPRWALLVTLLVFTFLARVKFTFTVLTVAVTGLGIIAALWRQDWRGALLRAAGYPLAFLGWWLAAGQNPIRIPRWLELSGEISRGYGGAMSMEPAPGVFPVGLLVAAAIAFWLWRAVRTAAPADRARAWPAAALAAGVGFVAWKHGFTRADGHVLGFFFIALFLAWIMPAYLRPTGGWRWLRLEAIAVLCLLGVWRADDTILAKTPAIFVGRIHAAGSALGHPAAYFAFWRDVTAGHERRHALPRVRAEVGDATIDFLNAEQGWLMLNGLAYSPRPIPQSYSAYTGELMSRNLGWFQREDRAPAYLLIDYLTIDGRYAAQDDALLLADLPRRYEPVLTERNLLLARRRAIQPPADNLPRKITSRGGLGFGENFAIPVLPAHALWLKLDPAPTGLGRLRAAAYKPPELRLVLRELDGHEHTYRLVPDAAREGFLIQPFLPDRPALEAFLDLDGPRRVTSFRVEFAAPDHSEFWRSLSYELSFVPHLPLGLGAEALHTLLVRSGVSTTAPARLDFPTPPEIFEIEGAAAILAHSPAELRFAATDSTRHFTGLAGLRPGAYTGDARTDGVTFRLVAETADGTSRDLWSRRLEPTTAPADRGGQPFAVEVPAGVTVRLLTEPGPNANWDWSYWSRLQFTP